jgi:hypothetical protein
MHRSATKCIEIIGKWCKNKHGASKIIDTFETYQGGSARDGAGEERRSAGRGGPRGRRGGRPWQRSSEEDELPFLFHFFLFNWASKWAMSMSACIDSYIWVPPVRFGVNSRLVRIAKNIQKVMVFQNIYFIMSLILC